MRASAGLTLLLLLAAGASVRGQSGAMNSSNWWVETYGLVDATHPLAIRAEQVFRRMAAVADRRSSRPPRLILIRGPQEPQALALPDGGLVLNRAALALCYEQRMDETGDSRLGFVLGHELSHLATDDFWQKAAFSTALDESAGDDGDPVGAIVRDDETREMRADTNGLIYATMAGYDPQGLVSDDSFIKAWLSRPAFSGSTTRVRLRPATRVRALRAQLQQVGRELDVFHFGTRLLQLGRNEDALILLERFRASFPGREVLNDIGVAHLQIALGFLATCSPEEYARFRLPLEVDPGTLARVAARYAPLPSVRYAASPELACVDSRRFRDPWEEAIRNLQLARNLDERYVPARRNLISALLFGDQGTQALNESNDALLLQPEGRELRLLRAVALYRMGGENGLDTADTAIDSLRDLAEEHPEYPDAAYNLARLLTERGRPATATAQWLRFLQLVPAGPHADEARRWVPATAVPRPAPRRPSVALPPPPLPLGSSAERLVEAGFDRYEFQEGQFTASISTGANVRALAIDDVIELVEAISRDRSSPLQVYGAPSRIERARTGDLYFYPGLLVEWKAGGSRREVHFQQDHSSSTDR